MLGSVDKEKDKKLAALRVTQALNRNRRTNIYAEGTPTARAQSKNNAIIKGYGKSITNFAENKMGGKYTRKAADALSKGRAGQKEYFRTLGAIG